MRTESYLAGFFAPFFAEGAVGDSRAETDNIDALGLDFASQRVCNGFNSMVAGTNGRLEWESDAAGNRGRDKDEAG